MPATISAANNMAAAKSCDGRRFEVVVVGVRVTPSKRIPQNRPPRMTRIEPTSEVIAIAS
jgi:hypothetical protein